MISRLGKAKRASVLVKSREIGYHGNKSSPYILNLSMTLWKKNRYLHQSHAKHGSVKKDWLFFPLTHVWLPGQKYTLDHRYRCPWCPELCWDRKWRSGWNPDRCTCKKYDLRCNGTKYRLRIPPSLQQQTQLLFNNIAYRLKNLQQCGIEAFVIRSEQSQLKFLLFYIEVCSGSISSGVLHEYIVRTYM